MKGPSLQKTAALSAALHATLFLISMIVLKNSSRMMMPSPYVVNLVSPGEVSSEPAGSREPFEPETPVDTARAVEKAPPEIKIDERRIEDSIAALRAMKNVERIANVRRSVLSVSGGTRKTARTKQLAKTGTRGGATGGEMTYADKVRAKIHDSWNINDINIKNLEIIVSIKIMRDGLIKIQEIEKKSGNRYYDQQALKAIEMASPVTPPPYEMEFGIRFTP